MRAFAIDRFGEEGSLRDFPDPAAGPGELLVRINVAGVNPVDWKIRDGRNGERPFPLILGIDFAGVVEAVGAGVDDFHAGDRVFGAARKNGAFAERTVVPTYDNVAPVARIPVGVSDAQAAALPIPGLTATGSLGRLSIFAGDKLLILGGTGGVGALAVQIAHARGIHVIATARSGKESFARALGADEVITYDRDDVFATVKAKHPGGIAAVFDLVSDREAIKQVAKVLRRGGRVVSVIGSVDEGWFAEREITASNVVMNQTPQSSPAGLTQLAELVATGRLQVPIVATRPLADAGAVLDELKSGRLSGKVILDVAPAA